MISKSVPFPCANRTKFGLGRSVERPTSVHELRPGDIDVIGALGDSLVAANGAMEEFALGTMIEHRGVSFCIGEIFYLHNFNSKLPKAFGKRVSVQIFLLF